MEIPQRILDDVANELTKAQRGLERLIKAGINIKLVTRDRKGSTFVEPIAIEVEDDAKITLVIEAGPESPNGVESTDGTR